MLSVPMPVLIVYLQALQLMMKSCVCYPEPVRQDHGSRLYRWQFMPDYALGPVLVQGAIPVGVGQYRRQDGDGRPR